MPLLTLSQIDKNFGDTAVLSGITLKLEPGEKAGLIGPNGCGKSTLLKIITGDTEPDAGELHLSKGARLGYLPQQAQDIKESTLRGHLEYPLRHLISLRHKIKALEKEIAREAEKEGRSPERLLKDYADLVARFEDGGGYQYESKLLGVARGLGFAEEDFDRPIKGFSGGEKTRARLAGLLLQEHDLLLLDEPTNFLDLAALQWLEKYLSELSCAIILVSHDRYFLDRVTNTIFALEGHRLKIYGGNYTYYQKLLAEEYLSTEREYKKMLLLKEREERLVREAKGDERSKKQARSRQKRLDKLEEAERIEKPRAFKLGLDYSGRSGRLAIGFDAVSYSYGDNLVLSNISFDIASGDRVAIVGPNGAGKSTLLKIIMKELAPQSGTIRLGPAVEVNYFSQEQEQLLPQHTLLETIMADSDLDTKQARNHLGKYLFRGDDVFKEVRDLSGGEKSRLALARLALSSGNCLLMDEPTSHLDLPALEALEKVLAGYPGTLVVVSHDRYFLKGLVNRVFELGGGRLTVYERNFEEYTELKEAGFSGPAESNAQKNIEKQKRLAKRREKQAAERRLRRLKEEQHRLENEIHTTENEIEALEAALSDPQQYKDNENLVRLSRSLEEAQAALEEMLKRWEELATQTTEQE